MDIFRTAVLNLLLSYVYIVILCSACYVYALTMHVECPRILYYSVFHVRIDSSTTKAESGIVRGRCDSYSTRSHVPIQTCLEHREHIY